MATAFNKTQKVQPNSINNSGLLKMLSDIKDNPTVATSGDNIESTTENSDIVLGQVQPKEPKVITSTVNNKPITLEEKNSLKKENLNPKELYKLDNVELLENTGVTEYTTNRGLIENPNGTNWRKKAQFGLSAVSKALSVLESPVDAVHTVITNLSPYQKLQRGVVLIKRGIGFNGVSDMLGGYAEPNHALVKSAMLNTQQQRFGTIATGRYGSWNNNKTMSDLVNKKLAEASFNRLPGTDISGPSPSNGTTTIGSRNSIVIVNDTPRVGEPTTLTLQTYPREVQCRANNQWSAVQTVGRNNPWYFYIGADDEIIFDISWYQYSEHDNTTRTEPLANAKLLESWAKGNGYLQSPPVLRILWGQSKWLLDYNFILYNADYVVRDFQDRFLSPDKTIMYNAALYPSHITQTLHFKRVTATNTTSAEINFEAYRGELLQSINVQPDVLPIKSAEILQDNESHDGWSDSELRLMKLGMPMAKNGKQSIINYW